VRLKEGSTSHRLRELLGCRTKKCLPCRVLGDSQPAILPASDGGVETPPPSFRFDAEVVCGGGQGLSTKGLRIGLPAVLRHREMNW
jgi:hypothetical protein